jgi:hypothetical protein
LDQEQRLQDFSFMRMAIDMAQSIGGERGATSAFLKMYESDLDDHFEELKKEAEPIATRYVREMTGETTLRDTQDILFLPSYFTVRGCYAKFCLEKRGVRITTTNKGTVKKHPQPAIDGEDATNDVPSWQSYCEYWKRHYSDLKVRKPTEDTCGFCYPEQYRCDQLYCQPSKEVWDAAKKDQKERIQYKKMEKAAKLEVMTK